MAISSWCALFQTAVKILRHSVVFLRLNAHVVLSKMANSGGGQFSEDAQFPDRFAQPGPGELVPTTSVVLLPSRAVSEDNRIGRGV